MNVFEFYETDPKLEQEGVWHTLQNGGRIKLARIGDDNPRYVEARQRKLRERQLENAPDIAPDILTDMLDELLEEVIILAWDESSMGAPFTAENVRRAVKAPIFRREVVRLADSFASYRRQARAETEKN